MSENKYNLSQLEELAGGNKEFVDSMVETFLEHTPQQLQDMLEAYKNGRLTELGGIAHKIKPNIDLFAIEDIQKDIRVVEEQAKNDINSTELKNSLKKVEQTLTEVFQQLEQR